MLTNEAERVTKVGWRRSKWRADRAINMRLLAGSWRPRGSFLPDVCAFIVRKELIVKAQASHFGRSLMLSFSHRYRHAGNQKHGSSNMQRFAVAGQLSISTPINTSIDKAHKSALELRWCGVSVLISISQTSFDKWGYQVPATLHKAGAALVNDGAHGESQCLKAQSRPRT